MNDSALLSMDKKVDILQASFEHYYKMAMDHHTKATTTSNILIVIIGALLVIIGLNEKICRSPEDIGSAIIITIIGIIGAIWVRKQYERYLYWSFFADRYHQKLQNLMPEFKTRYYYKDDAKCYIMSKGWILYLLSKINDISLWVLLHLIIMSLGILLFIWSILESPCP